ncbi:hypothetical protein BJL95_03570 [Methylomonas sp. LWB]|uniref:hypothetical protein n=1 Tax=Methylomonas sp. LWB TaxID=1905845 RepID=UPI0008DAC4BA|nr:hypothetical protein [Methylomonas sp. LWB]OHX34234.1 hypothetical protein BJL95_03570 [Methylomonas sp. LWB]
MDYFYSDTGAGRWIAPACKAGLFTLGLALTLGLSSRAALADIVDQANDSTVSGGFTLNAGPIGQSFRPGLASLHFVELMINDQNPDFGAGDDIALRIREADISGTILGVSETVFFADQPESRPFHAPELVRFNFAAPVGLTAGNTYVWEVFRNGAESSDLGIFGTGFKIDAYAQGEPYFGGAVYAGSEAPFDLWFREGIATVPVPAALPLMLSGIAILRLLGGRRSA